jgi:cysteine synthase
MVGRLLREEGLLVGGTSGAAVVAARRVAETLNLAGPVVAVLADSWDRYFTQEWMRKLACST